MWIRCKIIALTGFALLSLLVPAASGQQDDKPIVQNTAPGKFQKIPNLPDCITAAVEQGDPTKGASVLDGQSHRWMQSAVALSYTERTTHNG